jgi:hypothetical protein
MYLLPKNLDAIAWLGRCRTHPYSIFQRARVGGLLKSGDEAWQDFFRMYVPEQVGIRNLVLTSIISTNGRTMIARRPDQDRIVVVETRAQLAA